MSCDPALTTAPRCRLRRLYTQPGVTVTGYGDDDLVVVPDDATFTVGRVADAEVSIAAMIGGLRTYTIYWRAPDWIFHVNNEWAVVTVDGVRIDPFNNAPLRDRTVVEVRDCHTNEPVHRFRVEIG